MAQEKVEYVAPELLENDAGGRRQDRFVIMLAAKPNGEGQDSGYWRLGAD